MTATLDTDRRGRPVSTQGSSGTTPHGPAPATSEVSKRKLHLLAVSVALTVLTFVQAPGRIAPDTKADLSIDPLGFLLRAGHLWEPLGDSGQLQNQAYGYFLPMGPFYALGHLLGFPAWIVQRAWWATVLLVAFHGMYRLCQRFEVGNHPIQIIAALTFALSPRMITEVGPVSIEAWPMAMAPWVLLPLIKVRPGGEATAAARSGLAVALCGGVNAIAVGAVLPLPVWWLMTREKGPVRRSLIRWWALAVTLATFWWVVPLLLLGRFSPPFLDWVESAAVSTSKGTLTGAFRGTTQWVAWFALPQPIWLAGWSVLSSPAGILLSWVLITTSLLGMLRRDTPNRRFLIGASIAGLALLTLGHTGPLTAPWAPAIQTFMDGAGAPLRNTHKFDVVLRLPLTLALAHALTKVTVPRLKFPGIPAFPRGPRLAQFVAVCALIGSAAPALVGQLPARGSFEQVPNYWRQAAQYLADHDDGARTLIVPGSTFATSVWGDPHDEPFQALARTKWATRSGVPLSSAGNIRLLNVIEQQLETGRGSPGLAEFLSRAGISRVLLRSDLVRSFQPGSPPLPVTVRSALQSSPGLSPEAVFGDELKGTRNVFEVADDGLDVPQRAIEIWKVDEGPRIADVFSADSAVKVAGGPEALLSMAEAGQLGNRPVVLAGDPEAQALQGAPLVATDTIQRREANFAQVRDNYSAPMTADQPYVNKRKVHDWLPFDGPEVTARYGGISGVTTSTAAATATGGWYALDGDTSTTWTSGIFAVDQWIKISFPQPVSFASPIRLTPGSAGARIAAVETITDRGAETTSIGTTNSAGQAQSLTVPAGTTRTVEIRVTKVWPGEELRPVSISDIELPDITPSRSLVLPETGSTEPSAISLHAARDGVNGCVFSKGDAICSPRLQQQSQDADLDRIVNLPAAAGYSIRATARPKATAALDTLLLPAGSAMTATASSRRSNEPAERPQSVVDRNAGTGWVAAANDLSPTLTLTWPGERFVNRVRWQMDPQLAASKPASIEVVAGGRRTTVVPDEDGWVTFPRVRTDTLQLIVRGVAGLQSIDRASGYPTYLPVGASEIVVAGSADSTRLALPAYRSIQLACGLGPPVQINGTTVQTRLSGTTDQIVRRAPLSVVPCSSATARTLPQLRAGENRVVLKATPTMKPESLTLTNRNAADRIPETGTTVAPLVRELGAEHRTVTVDRATSAQILVVHENINPGWKATLAGETLAPIRIDGWQQGFVVPAGLSGTIDLKFTPGPLYRIVLVTGILLVMLLAAMAFPRRAPVAQRRLSSRPTSRHAAAVPLLEASDRRYYGVLGTFALVLLGGWWGLGAIVAMLVAVRRRVQMRVLIVLFGALAGVAASTVMAADTKEDGLIAQISFGAAMVLVAALVVRLDAAGGRTLAGISVAAARLVPTRRRRPAAAGTETGAAAPERTVPEPVIPEPVIPELVIPEPVIPVEARPAQAEPEPVRAEPVRAEPVRAEPVRAEPFEVDPAPEPRIPPRIPEPAAAEPGPDPIPAAEPAWEPASGPDPEPAPLFQPTLGGMPGPLSIPGLAPAPEPAPAFAPAPPPLLAPEPVTTADPVPAPDPVPSQEPVLSPEPAPEPPAPPQPLPVPPPVPPTPQTPTPQTPTPQTPTPQTPTPQTPARSAPLTRARPAPGAATPAPPVPQPDPATPRPAGGRLGRKSRKAAPLQPSQAAEFERIRERIERQLGKIEPPVEGPIDPPKRNRDNR